MLLRHFIEYRVDKGQSILSSFLITSGCLDHIPTLFTTTESALRNPQWSWKILSHINNINFYIDAYIDSCNIWSYLPRSIYFTYFYIGFFIFFQVSGWISPRSSDGRTWEVARPPPGPPAEGAQAELQPPTSQWWTSEQRFRLWDWHGDWHTTMSGMTKPKWLIYYNLLDMKRN